MEGFEWDPSKNVSNMQKHGISFEEAALIFEGHVLSGHGGHDSEFREKSYGLLGGVIVVCVIHTERNGKIRIISARRATPSERKLFDAYLKKALS